MTSSSLPIPLPVATRSASPLSRERIAADLKELIDGEVRFGEHERMLYATDASIYQVEPIGVVCPRHISDVERVIRYCAEHGLPILPRGGGTSLTGQTVNHAVIIDFSVHCCELVEIDVQDRQARVQPGIVLEHLNAALSKHGLMFGPDVATASHANLGGMIGNNSAGARSLVYGRTVEHLIAVDVLLASGERLKLGLGAADNDSRVRDLTQRVANVILPREMEIERRFPRTIRHVDGYNLDLTLAQLRASTPGTFDQVNLAHLVCGSEGTLAVTAEATLNLVPVPKMFGLAIVSFPDVDQALRSLMNILATNPSAVELIDDVVISMAKENVECCRYIDLLPQPPAGAVGAVLYVEYFANDHEELCSKFDRLQARFPGHVMNRCTDAVAMAQAWKLRKSGEPLLHALPGLRKPITFIEDLAVNPDRLADFVADFRKLVTKHGTRAAYYAHASVGCLHIRPLVDIRNPHDMRMMQAMAEEATDLVMRYGGALSGEHGDGRVRSHLLERFYGREICDAFRAIKHIFDPEHRLNPGNIVEQVPERMVQQLRVRPQQDFIEIPQVETYFRYDREHGFSEAVHQCNGAGVCRKMKGGTMCPSYRGTLDERHSTRGRGNALRLAITGQFERRWNDTETLKTLDLCLSCKACKSECPSNVDIAKLKAEYLAQSYDNGRAVPLSSRVFGNVRLLNRIGSAMHPVANLLVGIAPLRRLAQSVLGMHPKRALPRFERSLYKWMAGRMPRHPDGPSVILFPDCFTVYNEPRIGMATVRTLERLGYRVVLPDLNHGCCGRALISTGQLSRALDVCGATAVSLIECFARENAIAVVGCEPSCISAIKDDWLDLRMDVDREKLRQLASHTYLAEQFIDEHWSGHPISPPSAAVQPTRPIIVHTHCHQKALWGSESSTKILKRLFGDRVTIIDSGCCGMAGSFGYMREHFDLSMRIGEVSVFAHVKDKPDSQLAAPGTSCRQQLLDGIGCAALHPIELIASAWDVRA